MNEPILARLTKEIQQDIRDLTRFMPLDRLEELLRRPLLQMDEPAAFLLPSLALAGDGPVLTRILLLSARFICEVRVTSPDTAAYDFAARERILNYRFEFTTQEIREGEIVKNKFYLASLIWSHHTELHTRLDFVGKLDERERWVDRVLAAMPISSVVVR